MAEGKQKAFKTMTDLGMPKDQALDLLARFDLGDVERQIAWLPSRNAKNPARFLAAAIEGGYDMPLNLRRHAPTAGNAAVGDEAAGETSASKEGSLGDQHRSDD